MKKTTTSGNKKTSIPKLAVDSNSSVNVRAIENGFIISESGYTGKGRNQQYYDRQYYSATNPVAAVTGKMKFGGKK